MFTGSYKRTLNIPHYSFLIFSTFVCSLHFLCTQLQECVGAAVIAVGPEKVLSLVPISLNAETCSNAWLIPILKKYVVGASLQYFMDHIVPLAKSIQDVSDKGAT